jgi:hypothetical protein
MKSVPIKNRRSAQIAIEMLFLAAIIVTVIGGFISLAGSFLQLSVRAQNKLQAFAIAESGIEYYRWHLAHAPVDYQDGTGHAGPYVHNYYDKDGNVIGQFTLTITPPPPGSTIVTISSAGTVLADSSIKKIIKVQMGIPSFAKYAWVLNSNVDFGSTAQVDGVIDSNGGIRFDGTAHNLVESALTTYSDPDNGNANEWAVYTGTAPADPQPPTALPTSSSNIFLAGRSLGVPAIDFTGLTQDLATIESTAQATGYYATGSGVFGYDLALSTTSFTVYKVTALVTAPGGCTNAQSETGWGTWSIKTESQFATGTIPQNGNMFFADNLWVRGTINGARVTIASGKFPANASTYTNIIVNSSTYYTNFNGTDTIALIAQNNIIFGLNSDNNLTVDAALIAQNGSVRRYYYGSSCGSSYLRNQLTTLGIIGSNQQSGVAWGDPVTSGYSNRSYNYDANLLYAPPPSFPLTTDEYSLISWEEVQ